MYNNKRGLSTVVTTLIIILLVLVAIGIIWIVIRGVIETGGEEIDFRTKCLNVDVRATNVVTSLSAGHYMANVSLERRSGSEPIAGVKLVFHNTTSAQSGDVQEYAGDIGLLSTKTAFDVNTTLTTKPNNLDVVAFFLDSQGNDYICPTTNEFNF